ncbi:MAG: transcriptional regulator [Deltaproteobacteria bacterium HGW-Deltaproteobacteria-9]|nr:MAG: transcriptional regulator [Deltaproteobacteria bacterium HGW-Deltaproteobacteria-9]
MRNNLIFFEGYVSKGTSSKLEIFGKRLADLRKLAGYTQRQLAEEIGVSQRVIAYYEGETKYPPTTLLPFLALALGVSTDELLGLKPVGKPEKLGGPRLQRRLQEIEKLPPPAKKQLLQFLDTFIEREKLKKTGTSD